MMLWQLRLSQHLSLVTIDNEPIEVVDYGRRDIGRSSFSGCTVSIRGYKAIGRVVFISSMSTIDMLEDTPILHISDSSHERIVGIEGMYVPQCIGLPLPKLEHLYEGILRGREQFRCGLYLATFDPFRRISMFTNLYIERLRRKCLEINEIFAREKSDWEQTLYMVLFRTMGGGKNKRAYETLASRVPLHVISRESNSILSVEALLLGASGLLTLYARDKYVVQLQDEYEFLSRKYGILEMSSSSWSFVHNNPRNHPILRIAQLSTLLSTTNFLFEKTIECKTKEDLYRLFCVEASEYWATHFVPGRISKISIAKGIGRDKAELLGINFVAPMQFAYASYMCNEQKKEVVVEFVETLSIEKNYITKGWVLNGVELENAFDSQAVIQLYNEYCLRSRCSECNVCKEIIKDEVKI